SRPTWPAAAPTSCSAATRTSSPRRCCGRRGSTRRPPRRRSARARLRRRAGSPSRSTRAWSRSAGFTSWARSVTRRAGWTTGYAPEDAHPEDWDLGGLGEALFRAFDVRIPPARFGEAVSREGLAELVGAAVRERYAERERELGADLMRALERHEMLVVMDTQWKDHLLSIDHLKEGIGLRGYGQRDPLTEYKKEAFDLFQDMVERVKAAVVERLFKVQVVRDAPMALPAMTAWADARESRGALPTVPEGAS